MEHEAAARLASARVGSAYGGWAFHADLLHPRSTLYSTGAGRQLQDAAPAYPQREAEIYQEHAAHAAAVKSSASRRRRRNHTASSSSAAERSDWQCAGPSAKVAALYYGLARTTAVVAHNKRNVMAPLRRQLGGTDQGHTWCTATPCTFH